MNKDNNEGNNPLKSFLVTVLIILLVMVWWEWCKEKPMRFLYSLLILGSLMYLTHINSYAYQHPDCILCN